MIADQAFGQDHDDLAQVVFHLGPLRWGKRLVCLALGEEHIPRSQFRVEAQKDVGGRHALGKHVAQHLHKEGVGQVVSEIKVGQRIAKVGQPALPDVGRFLGEGIGKTLMLLGEESLVLDLALQVAGGDDPPGVELAAHALADRRRQDGILADLQVELQDLR